MATPTSLPAAVSVGDLATAAYANDIRGAFRILQIVQSSTATFVSNSTTTMTDTGLTATITPQSNTNKVLVVVAQTFNKTSGNAGNAVVAQIVRGATAVNTFSGATGYTGTTLDNIFCISAVHLDSPATTSATTYKTQLANYSPFASVGANPNTTTATITLLEVSA